MTTVLVENRQPISVHGVEGERMTRLRRVAASVRWRGWEVTRRKDFDDAHGGAASRAE